MFGRLGCLMNGCCYGGVCEMPLPTVRFPSGSPVYMEQLESGRILGLVTENGTGERRKNNQLGGEQRSSTPILLLRRPSSLNCRPNSL